MESSNGPKMSTEPSQGNLSGHSPNLPPPSYMAPQPPSGTGPSSSNYQNVVLLPDRTPVSKGTQPDDDSNKSDKVTASNGNKQETRHMTVIQLGSGAASTSTSKSTGSLGGKQTLAPSPPTTLSSASTRSSSELKVNCNAGANIQSSPSHPVANSQPSASNNSPSVAALETSKLTSSTSFTGQSYCASPAKADKRKSLPPNGTKESNRQSFTLPQDIVTRL